MIKVIEVKNIVPQSLRISAPQKPKPKELSLAALSIWPLTLVSTIIDNPNSSPKAKSW
jgi:hypothetical protein